MAGVECLAPMLIGLFPILLATSTAPIHVSQPVAKLVAPVLNKYAGVSTSEDEKSIDAFEKTLDRVLNKTTDDCDAALAVLIRFYLGERSGEEMYCESVHRGKRMLPLLAKYVGRRIIVPGVDMSRTRPIATLSTMIGKAIRAC